MIIHLIILFITGDLALTLQCKTVRPSKCRWNSSCEHDIETCHETLPDVRGGVYCATLIYSSDEILVENMGCMYDQEITKTCQNQTQCLMKFTSSEKKFLHCCCDKDFCNLNINLSNPFIQLNRSSSLSISNYDCFNVTSDWTCKYRSVWAKSSIVFVLFMIIVIVLFVILFSMLISQWNSIKRFFSRLIDKTKSTSTSIIEQTQQNKDVRSPLLKFIDQQDKFIPHDQFEISKTCVKQGKFAEIYLGTYENQRIAIKCFNGNCSNSLIDSMFNHEKAIYLLPNMNHVNILKFIGYSTKEMNSYLIFDYADCGSLKDYLRLNLIANEIELINMLRQISEGIEYLHRDFRIDSSQLNSTRSPIAHRDLKSDNILRYSNGILVICDLAMSVEIDQHQFSTSDHQQIGTTRYMAPEILAGTISNDINALLRCDVYAIGLIFWEILSRCSTLERSERYMMPYEQQLIDRGSHRNPSIEEMLQIVNMDSPHNRPFIQTSWRTSRKINEILLTIEQCWQTTPDGRINSSLVAHRIRQIESKP